jgi:hypothetical protein
MINTFSDKKDFFVPTMIFIDNSRDYFTFTKPKITTTFTYIDKNPKYEQHIKL